MATEAAGTAQFDYELQQAVLNRMNITWEPDPKTVKNIQNAIDEAQDRLRKVAGSPGLSFEGDNRTLLIICAWYIVESKLADFMTEYNGELNMLRFTEGFNCGKEESSI